MTDSTAHDRRESLGGNLDRLAERAGGVLSRARLTVRVRQVLSRTVSLLCLFALPGLLFELLRFLAGYAAPGLRWWQHAALVLAFASVFAAGWLWRDYRSHRFARGATLGLFDRQLGLANRLATADEFIAAPGRSGFMAAAIDDAVEPAERAMHSQAQPIHVDRQWHLSRWSLASVPGTAGLLLLTTWLGGLELANAGGVPAGGASSPDLAVIGTVTENPAGETGMRSAAEPLRLARSDADPGNTASADAPESEAGHTAANPSGRSARQQGGDRRSTSSQSRGMPSGSASRPRAAASGQQAARSKPSASGQQDRQAAAEPQAASGERQAASETDTSSPAGESGSSDSPGDSGQSGDDGQDSGAESAQAQAGQGEGEESESQSGAGQGEEDDQRGEGEQSNEGAGEGQRTAEGESQNNGESGGEPDARAQRQSQGEGGQPDFGQQSAEGTGEGRSSGEDVIKKNRGAAKAMLAVPTADRLIGRRGEGPEQTRQEQSPPLEEQVAPVPASARPQRGDRIGTLQHARVSGWSRDLVMSYFDRPQDEAAGDKTEPTNTNTDTNAGNGQGE